MLPTRYASFLKRLVAHVVDVIIAWCIAGFFIFPLVLFLIGSSIFSGFMLSEGWHPDDYANPAELLRSLFAVMPSLSAIFLIIAVNALITWFYFAIFESSPRQATPGKMLVGIFVTDQLGQRISFLRALGRVLSKILSKLFCYIGYLIALFTERNQALHDMLAGTLVLEPAWPAPQADIHGSGPAPVAPPAVDYPGGLKPQAPAAEKGPVVGEPQKDAAEGENKPTEN